MQFIPENHRLLLLLVNEADFEGVRDGLLDKINELRLDGKGVEIFGGPELELGEIIIDLLDLNPFGVRALSKVDESLWGCELLRHEKGSTKPFLSST